jgi:TonB-linked SusC/RagA family outer membrane protein
MQYQKNSLFILLLLLLSSMGFSQRTITGVVYDINRNTLPGATVVVPGTTTGTITDIDGNFTLQLLPGQNVIDVSFIGYLPEVIEINNATFFEVILMPSIEQLQEVIVTALGIKRESKALGYSVQQVQGEALTNASRINPLSGLVGQVAGLQISESGSGAGGSSRILIRGANSLTGSNDPLYVVDGVPLSNAGASGGGQFGGFDYGSGINNLNLDDIESITVLKGGAASALYGYRGSNGVIMITTRRGSRKEGIGVSYQIMASTASPLVKPEFQTQFSQGTNGSFGRLSTQSWGAKMQGQEVANFLGETVTLNPVSNHPYDDFFRNPLNIDHTLTFDKSSENSSVLFSASWNKSDGMIRTNEIDKKSFNIRYDSKLTPYLTVDARANYINQHAFNRPNLAGSPDNPIYLMYNMPASVTLDQLRNYQTSTGLPVVWNTSYSKDDDGIITAPSGVVFATSPLLQNPYWATNLNTNQDQRHRLLGLVNANINFTEMLSLGFDLDLSLKAGMDYFQDTRNLIVATNTYYKAGGLATGRWSQGNFLEGNYDFLLGAGQQWGDFTLRTNLGGNIMQRQSRSLSSSSESGLINQVGPYVIQNYNNIQTSLGLSDQEVHSLYGMLSADYRRIFFLDYTYRHDWTSVLAPSNWAYGYQSVSASLLLEEVLNLQEQFGLLKLRASLAETGSAGSSLASRRFFGYGTSGNQFHGLPYGFLNSARPDFLLESELTISNEVGIEAIMLGNRLRVDLSYYEAGTRNQIFENPMAPSSGFNSGWVNSGFIKNTGIELFSSYRIIDNRDFQWTSSLNFTRQWSKVEEISPELDRIILSDQLGASQVQIAAMYNQPAGVILGTAFARDSQGRILLNSENLPIAATTEAGGTDYLRVIGNATPEILWGFGSQLSYKRVFLNFQVDSRLGHQLFSFSNMRGAENGTLAFTTPGRDDWYRAVQLAAADPNLSPTDFNMGFRVKGVRPGSDQEGEYYVDPQKYWEAASRIHEAFVYDASFVRLRQLSVGYNFSPALLNVTPFREISFSIYANNLFYLMRKTENVSPESSFGTENNQGFEIYGYPEMRTIGANLKLSL